MADKKISDFSTLTELSDNDLLLISSGQTTYNTRFSTVKGEAADAAVDEISSAVVRHDVTQSLNTEAKTRARTNIDAASVSAVNTAQTTADNAVKYNAAQSLNTTEKAMARSNINAMDASNSVVLYTTQTLTTDQQAQARANIGVSSGGVTGAVLYDSVQSLSSSEQATARGNIGAMDADASVVRYTSQTLDSSQKLQARTNIGAMDEDSAVVKYSAQSLTTAQQEQARSNIDAVGPDDVDDSIAAVLRSAKSYSTSEVATGGLWLNGKPLYRRTYEFTTAGTTSLSDLGYDYIQIIENNIHYRYGTGEYWGGQFYWGGDVDRGQFVIENGGLRFRYGTNVNPIKAWATVQYTKTADSALS